MQHKTETHYGDKEKHTYLSLASEDYSCGRTEAEN